MNCQTASQWMAGWADEQLSPAEHELMDSHLRRCPECRAIAQAMARQDLRPPDVPALPPDFWNRMDTALQQATRQTQAAESQGNTTIAIARPPTKDHTAPPSAARWVRPLLLATYICVLSGVLGWGLSVHSALQDARAQAASLQAELERERRLTGQPVIAAPMGYRMPVSHSNRGTL